MANITITKGQIQGLDSCYMLSVENVEYLSGVSVNLQNSINKSSSSQEEIDNAASESFYHGL